VYSQNQRTYKGNGIPKAGETYSVVAEINGEKFQATSKVPLVVPITSVVIDSSKYLAGGGRVEMSIGFTDPKADKNFYCIRVVQKGYDIYQEGGDTIRFVHELAFEPVDPRFHDKNEGIQNGDNTYYFINELLFRDDFFEGKDYQFRFYPGYLYGQNTESLQVVLLSISKEYYNYFLTKKVQDYGGQDPFSQPAQVFSNIENGVGIFAGFSSYSVEVK
jgi:hypothetical protein